MAPLVQARGTPHLEQNFEPGALLLPHEGQMSGNAEPHWLQNLARSETSARQLGHSIPHLQTRPCKHSTITAQRISVAGALVSRGHSSQMNPRTSLSSKGYITRTGFRASPVPCPGHIHALATLPTLWPGGGLLRRLLRCSGGLGGPSASGQRTERSENEEIRLVFPIGLVVEWRLGRGVQAHDQETVERFRGGGRSASTRGSGRQPWFRERPCQQGLETWL
jgi:hypothetical protein